MASAVGARGAFPGINALASCKVAWNLQKPAPGLSANRPETLFPRSRERLRHQMLRLQQVVQSAELCG
jgi:hypothetical protein